MYFNKIGVRGFILSGAPFVQFVCEHLAAWRFARKRMRVGQRDLAAIGLPDMGDHGPSLDRMGADETRHVGSRARLRIEKGAHGAAFVKGDAPPVTMRAGLTAARRKTGEGKSNVGRDIRAHSKKFTHGPRWQAGVG